MGPELVETFVTMKRFECERYRQHVSEWDRDEYIHHL
jgi:glutamine synthetase